MFDLRRSTCKAVWGLFIAILIIASVLEVKHNAIVVT